MFDEPYPRGCIEKRPFSPNICMNLMYLDPDATKALRICRLTQHTATRKKYIHRQGQNVVRNCGQADPGRDEEHKLDQSRHARPTSK